MKIKAEDTAALIIDFQEKLVPAIADHDEIVAKGSYFCGRVEGIWRSHGCDTAVYKGTGRNRSCDEGSHRRI